VICQLVAEVAKVEEMVELADERIAGNLVFKLEALEQLVLTIRLPRHHRQSLRICCLSSGNSAGYRRTSAFFNTICRLLMQPVDLYH
jgi:hypothetical protein